MNMWYKTENVSNDKSVVVSTRVRLARNFSNFPFPNVMTLEQKNEVISEVEKALKNASFGKDIKLKKIEMQSLDSISANAMCERRLFSKEFADNREGRAIFISDDERVSVLVNEEDHVRIQVLSAGSDLPVSLKLASEIESLLDSKINFAFDETLGYLTQCPTNLGTGLRASVMLHLPMMEKNSMMNNLSNTVSKLGMTVRGSMGEGSLSQGALYQISNQVTLGISEQTAIDNLMSIVNQVIHQELALRNSAYENDKIAIEDKVYRAFGLLSNSRLMSSDELLGLVSILRLGVSLEIIKIDIGVLNSLLFETGAYNVSINLKDKNTVNRDIQRAKTVREKIQ